VAVGASPMEPMVLVEEPAESQQERSAQRVE